MKLLVLVPGDSYRKTAGARIRYGRLIAPLAERGIQLELRSIDRIDLDQVDPDFLLICKCHDARAQLIAAWAQGRGVPVGVDLFDDYFSQQHDARLVRFRHWLEQLSPRLSFILTSTSAMSAVAEKLAPEIPVQLLNDAAAGAGQGALMVDAHHIEAKLRETLDEQRIRVTWFGIGDNPYFPVGLSDLAAYAGELVALGRLANMAVELTVLTNARSLAADGLSQLSTLPISCTAREWSESAEAELLQCSFLCFLPVNAQPFSIAKSLNRAITALSHGAQILSPGYPLYEQLAPFVYRHAKTLAEDIRERQLRVSANTRDALAGKLNDCASAEIEAEKLVVFLGGLPAARKAHPKILALVHGAGTTVPINQFAHATSELVIGSPYAPLAIQTYHRADFSLPFQLKMRTGQSRKGLIGSLSDAPLGVQMALYCPVMQEVEHRLRHEMGADEVIHSENSPVPYLAGCRKGSQ